MTNKTKIIIGILIIAIVVVAILGIVQKTKSEDNKTYENKESINNIFDEYVDEEKKDNETKNIVEENNTIENSVSESKTNNVQNENSPNTVIGKEEQESNKENTEATDKQQAIDLAKQEWAISVDSYDFQAELKEDKIYEVSVINKTNRNVITIYTVNLKTGTVVE